MSPYSIWLLLGLLYEGASGQTRDELMHALNIDPNRSPSDYITEFASTSELQLDIANALWCRSDVLLLPEFEALTRNKYRAHVDRLDFDSPAAVHEVNNWACNNTNGKIPSIITNISPEDILVAANAVYFKGRWADKFDGKLTVTKTFHRLDGATKPVQMMHRRAMYQYFETPELQAVSLPYADSRFSMCVLLPAPSFSLETLLSQIAEQWLEIQRSFDEAIVDLYLPRFMVTFETELQAALESLGVWQLFDSDPGGLTRISEQPLYVSAGIHKAMAEVNEVGTEAAAVTTVFMRAGSAAPRKLREVEMIVDRPFLFVIYDLQTEALLFLGSVANPQERQGEP